jgi:hypothetical protein
MAKYAIDGQDTNTAATTILQFQADPTTARRIKLGYATVGSDATPADNAAEYNLQRFTVVGATTTAVTPRPLDMADAAALTKAHEAANIEPTYTTDLIMLNFMANQRATFQWYAAPGYEIVVPATTNSGLGLLVVTVAGSAINTGCTFHVEEQ